MRPYPMNSFPFSLAAPQALTLSLVSSGSSSTTLSSSFSSILYSSRLLRGGGGGYDYSRLLVGMGVQFCCFKVDV